MTVGDVDEARLRMMACYKPMASFFLLGLLFRELLLAVLVLAPPTIFFTYQAAYRAFGLRYAVSHLLLLLALTPVFGLGVLVVPALVDSDIARASGRLGAQR